MKNSGYIFDMDGTLTDSMGAWRNLSYSYLRRKGKVPKPDLIEKIKPMSMKQSAAYFQEEYGITDSCEEMIEEEMSIIRDFYKYEVELKPGAAQLLEYAKQSGAKMCIASATEKNEVEIALRRCGVLDYFEFIITCSESSGKDEPQIFEDALARLGTPKEGTVVVEDAYYAAKTAAEAGFRVYGVYDATVQRNREKISALCEIYADDPADLLRQMKE
ncbi:MAG: HAD family hydrolase [Anaerovoracaceae bacterium]|jgi:HAD superfamily hydrolase (TIGR01509 family)